MVVQKDVFWKAGIITAIVFILGILLGSSLESSRTTEIMEEYQRVEVEWADLKLQSNYFQVLNPKYCDTAIKENLNFADRVYQEGLKIQRYEEANNLKDEDELLYEKQRYTLFKIEFWLNSINLKEKCDADYINVVYFYNNKPSLMEQSKQDTLSIILNELKQKYAEKIMLIPVPLDLNINTVDVIKSVYNIQKSPTVLIAEKIKLEDVKTMEEIENELRTLRKA